MSEIVPMAADSGNNWRQWRKMERARLIEKRMAIPAIQRKQWDQSIAKTLIGILGDPTDYIISAYWPFRAEPDLRPLLRELRERGIRVALPVVIAKGEPLIFREWLKGSKLGRGVWDIPIPAEGSPVTPNVILAPVVGFDPAGFRLGYGGGFFDRTLASIHTGPAVFGIGYSQAQIPTIYPQSHDIPMERIITENGEALTNTI